MLTFNPADISLFQRELLFFRNSLDTCTTVGESCRTFLNMADLYFRIGKPFRSQALLSQCQLEELDDLERRHYEIVREAISRAIKEKNPDSSLNMIVKNEESNICQVLDSVDLLMDEIVICDTGSTDATVDKSIRYGVRIVHDPWRNDFSRARNTAIEASTGRWILWMDGDDRLEPEAIAPLQEFWKSRKAQALAVCVINDCDSGDAISFMQVRVFPRLPGVRFEQRIHEQIMYSAARNNIPFLSRPDIRIRHTGYRNAELNREKAMRNKTMLLEEIAERGPDPVLLFSLADVHILLQETEEAKKQYEAVIADTGIYSRNLDLAVQAHIYVAQILQRQNNYGSAAIYLQRALELDSTRIEAFFALGTIYLKENQIQKAIDSFSRCLAITPPLRMTASNDRRIKLEAVYYLSDLLIRQNRIDEAGKLLSSSISTTPNVPEYHTLYGNVLIAQNRLVEAMQSFATSIKLSPNRNAEAYRGIATIYRHIGDEESAQEYLAKIGLGETEPASQTQ